MVQEREREVVDIWEKRLWSYYFVRQEEQNMIIYLAGTTVLSERERAILNKKQERLVSYFFVQDQDQIQYKAFHDENISGNPDEPRHRTS